MSKAPTEVRPALHALREASEFIRHDHPAYDVALRALSILEAAIDTAVVAERERCAGIAESAKVAAAARVEYTNDDADRGMAQAAEDIESAIREGKPQ